MNKEERITVGRADAKEYFFRIGLAVLLLRVLNTGIQLGVQYLIKGISPECYTALVEGPWFLWVLSLAPLYLCALPVFWLTLPKSKERYEKRPMRFGDLLGSVSSCIPAMYAGNIIGIIVVAILSALTGGAISNNLTAMVDQSPMWVVFVCTVVIAPIGEELIFRKLLIDRIAPFGEAQAVIFSGLVFGLFHGNFNQFFYTAMLGMLMAYVYVKTKNIVYPIIMHASVNFIGSVFASWALEGINKLASLMESSEQYDLGAMVEYLIPFLVYLAVVVPLFIGGVIYFIIKVRKLRFDPPTAEVEGGTKKALWSNPAIIAAICVMAANFILSLMR